MLMKQWLCFIGEEGKSGRQTSIFIRFTIPFWTSNGVILIDLGYESTGWMRLTRSNSGGEIIPSGNWLGEH